MKHFDRYLLTQYLVTFCILVLSLFGLFVVIDLFQNLDDFSGGVASVTTFTVFQRVVRYYGLQSLFFLDLVGHIAIALALVISLIFIQRRGEFIPHLAAGTPVYRLIAPLVMGAVLLDLALVLNRELLVPRFAHHKDENRALQKETGHELAPTYDHSTQVFIGGRQVWLRSKMIVDARFVLPSPSLSNECTELRSHEAVFVANDEKQCRGWLLKSAEPPYNQLDLTEQGKKIVRPSSDGKLVFIRSDVGPDELYASSGSIRLQSTRRLLDRVRNASCSSAKRTGKFVVELHRRLTEPALNVVSALIVCFFMLRREARVLATSIGIGVLCLAAVLGIQQLCLNMAGSGLLRPDLAVWTPILIGGMLVSWSADKLLT